MSGRIPSLLSTTAFLEMCPAVYSLRVQKVRTTYGTRLMLTCRSHRLSRRPATSRRGVERPCSWKIILDGKACSGFGQPFRRTIRAHAHCGGSTHQRACSAACVRSLAAQVPERRYSRSYLQPHIYPFPTLGRHCVLGGSCTFAMGRIQRRCETIDCLSFPRSSATVDSRTCEHRASKTLASPRPLSRS